MRRRLERHGLWRGDRSELHVFSRVQARGADQLATRKALMRDGGRARRASFSQLASPPSMRHAAAHGACAAVDAAELDEASARLERLARGAASELPAAYARAGRGGGRGLGGGREEVAAPPPRPSSACAAGHAARAAAAAAAAAGTSASRAGQRLSSACLPSRRSSSVAALTQPTGGPAAAAAPPSAAALAPADEAGAPGRGAALLAWSSRREVERLQAALRVASGATLTHRAAARLEAAERSDDDAAAAAERHVARQKLAVQQRAAANRALLGAAKQPPRPVVVGSHVGAAESEESSPESLLRSLMATLSAVSGDEDAGVPRPRKAEAEGTDPELELSICDATPSVTTTVFQ